MRLPRGGRPMRERSDSRREPCNYPDSGLPLRISPSPGYSQTVDRLLARRPHLICRSKRAFWMTFSRKFPVWTVALSIVVFCVYFGHAAQMVGTETKVLVTDRGLFVIANPFRANIAIPLTDGTIMTELHPGNWGNWWVVNSTDHLPHVVNFRVLDQETGLLCANYNATISGNATVFVDLGSSSTGNFLATSSWT